MKLKPGGSGGGAGNPLTPKWAAAAVNVIAAGSGCGPAALLLLCYRPVGRAVGHALNFIFSSGLEAPWESGSNNKPSCNIVIGNVVGSNSTTKTTRERE